LQFVTFEYLRSNQHDHLLLYFHNNPWKKYIMKPKLYSIIITLMIICVSKFEQLDPTQKSSDVTGTYLRLCGNQQDLSLLFANTISYIYMRYLFYILELGNPFYVLGYPNVEKNIPRLPIKNLQQ